MEANEATAKPWDRRALALSGLGVLILLAAGVLLVLTYAGPLDGGPAYSGPETVTGFGSQDTPFVPAATPTPDAEAPGLSQAAISTLAIPRYDVEAPVIVMGVDSNGVMESPDGPSEVAWYDFSASPGTGSNSVFSGHVDWTFDSGAGPAVFWSLQSVHLGDLVEVRLADGTIYQYQVISRHQIRPEEAEVGKIVGPSEREILTMITCGGTFDRETRHYDQRTIVQAERILESAAAAPAN